VSWDPRLVARDDTPSTHTAGEPLQPDGWEIYGKPSDAVVGQMRETAAAFRVSLTLQPEYVAGLLRLTSG
jgi:hypothetical protein